MCRPGRLLIAAGALVGLGCASSRPVRPLGTGNAAVNTSVGGPMVKALGLRIPIPVLDVGGAYGVRDDLEVTAALDVTAGVYGIVHLEPGVAWHPVVREQGGLPSLTVLGSVHLLTNFGDVLVAPRASGVASWLLGGRHVLYAGADAAVAIRPSTRVLAGPLAGGELRLGRLGLGLELKWLAPYYDVEPAAPEWLSPGGRGFFSVLFGASYYLGGAR
jgi:hypothetical protein